MAWAVINTFKDLVHELCTSATYNLYKTLGLSVTTPFKTSVKYKIKFINKPHNKTLKLGIKSVYKTV